MDIISIPFSTHFECDEGNNDKNYKKHGVSLQECEEVFHRRPLILDKDVKHSMHEERFLALGRTNVDRLLFMAFTMRGKNVRVISARDMDRKERNLYEEIKIETA